MIDLHTHTTFSDGSLTPTQLVEEAAAMGLSAVAVTDHDTVDGLPEALAAGERLGIEVIPGVEINLEHDRVTMDMLGYFLAGRPSDELQEELAELRAYRDERNARMLERLAELGMPLDPGDLAAAAENGAVGRPHIGEAMVRRGYASSISEAFELYLRRGAPAWVDRRRLSLGRALKLLRASGALPVIAHPGIIRTDAAGLNHIVPRRRARRPRRHRVLLPAPRRGDGRLLSRPRAQVRPRAHRRLRLPRQREAQGSARRGGRRQARARQRPHRPPLRGRRPARAPDLTRLQPANTPTGRGYPGPQPRILAVLSPIAPRGIVARVEEYMDQDEAGRLINRLRRVEGQSRGLQRMIEEGRPCEEIFTQLAATKAALDRVGVLLISLKMRECLNEEAGDQVASPEAVEKALEAFLKYARCVK